MAQRGIVLEHTLAYLERYKRVSNEHEDIAHLVMSQQHVHCRQQACGGCFAFDDERGDLVDLFGILSILTPNMANAHEEQVAPVCCRHAVRDAHLYGVDDLPVEKAGIFFGGRL